MSLSITDKNQTFLYGCLSLHYSDHRFEKPQTIFLAAGYTTDRRHGTEFVNGVNYEYSDRLFQWYGEKCDKAANTAKNKNIPEKTPAFLEEYLQELFSKPNLRLIHIIAGVNLGNGYPYRIYGYITNEQEGGINEK